MKRAPTREAIEAAEARLAESRRKTRDGLHRARMAFRAGLTRPSTLALAAGAVGAAGLVGLWLGRRPRRRAAARKVGAGGAGVALVAYAAPFVQALIARYGKAGLWFLVDKVRTAWRTRAVRVAAEASKPSTPDGPAMGAPY